MLPTGIVVEPCEIERLASCFVCLVKVCGRVTYRAVSGVSSSDHSGVDNVSAVSTGRSLSTSAGRGLGASAGRSL